jgi:hypothetical protein
MKRLVVIVVILTVSLLLAGAASDEDRYWNEHGEPFSFLFGNHIDTHQETRLYERGSKSGELKGWLYVFDSGEKVGDTPVLKHCTGPNHYEAGCVAGWQIEAKPCIEEVNACRAMFLYHFHDHPVWLLGAHVDKQGALRGSRQDIVQPGSFTHFHWLTENSNGLETLKEIFGLEDIHVPEECNVDMASKLTSGVECPGYFLEIEALKPFGYDQWAFHHGSENLFVQPGIDNMTHSNLLTSYRSLPPDVLPGTYQQ